MAVARDEVKQIEQYILAPHENGAHLLQMARSMADEELRLYIPRPEDRHDAQGAAIEKAAETIATFIYLAWGGAGLQEYAKRTYEMLCALRDRMSGMHPEARWQYAIEALNVEILARLRRARNLVLDSARENELLRHFFDNLREYDFLHDLVRDIMDIHWQRRHSPHSPPETRTTQPNAPIGPRGGPILEKHLERAATEALAAYIEQANITRGVVENLADPSILLRDRVNLQRVLGAYDQQAWAAAGRQLAEHIESRFGTRAGRREARLSRARWRLFAKGRAKAAATSAGKPGPKKNRSKKKAGSKKRKA